MDDGNDRVAMTTVPLPPISFSSPNIPGDPPHATEEEFQGLAFVTRAAPRRRINSDESEESKKPEESGEKIGVALIFQERGTLSAGSTSRS